MEEWDLKLALVMGKFASQSKNRLLGIWQGSIKSRIMNNDPNNHDTPPMSLIARFESDDKFLEMTVSLSVSPGFVGSTGKRFCAAILASILGGIILMLI